VTEPWQGSQTMPNPPAGGGGRPSAPAPPYDRLMAGRVGTFSAHLVSTAGRARLGPAPLAFATVAVLDLLRPRAKSYAVLGVLDEPAHTATSVVLVEALEAVRGRPLPTAFKLGCLIGGNLIDADHVPHAVFGSTVLTAGTPRPYPHSVLTVTTLVALARATRRSPTCSGLLAGAAVGVSGHFLRDLGTGRVPLAWPLTRRGYAYRYRVYFAVLTAAAAGAAARRRLRPAPDRTA
jgi:hypothetical protein